MKRNRKTYEVHIPAYLTGDRVWDSSVIRIEEFGTKEEAYAWLSELGINEPDDCDDISVYELSKE